MEIKIHYKEHVIYTSIRKSKDQRWEFLTQVIWGEYPDSDGETFLSALTYNTEEQAMRGGLQLGKWWIDAGKPEMIELTEI